MIASNIASRPLRSPGRIRLGALGVLAVLLSTSRGLAQTAAEAQKPAPNVLLLVDSSGSMEFKTDGTFPTCTDGGAGISEKSRWINLVEVLTGTLDGYSCFKQDRSTSAFKSEFSLGGVPPYDFGYVNPYHRALSNNCVYGPGVVPATPYAWPAGAVNKFPFIPASKLVNHASPGCAAFSQRSDGLLDVYKDLIRFGLMTFDARVGAGTGVQSGVSNYTSGFDGNWSYYLNSKVTGHPGNCSFDMDQEVGARNAAAPPWEGRMIAFGPPNATDNTTRNSWIQEVLLSTRPYGATPIAGQLDDARAFLWNDTSRDPLDSTQDFGPTNDPNWRATNCRKTILIVLTDGEPNLDLRPFCEAEATAGQTAGRCPYAKPQDIVSNLRLGAPVPSMEVETYVVGFALGRVTPSGSTEISCSALTDAQCSDPLNNVVDQTRSKNIQACCTLNKIAAAGGDDNQGDPRKAYFADNPTELKAIFTDILDDVIQVATRTMPVYSSPGGDITSKGYKFFSAFDPQPDPTAPSLWEGLLERRRFTCTDDLVPEIEYDPNDGDDFAANLNSGAGPDRHFYSVIGASSRNSMRPFITADSDGLGTATGTTIAAVRPSDLVPQLTPASMEVGTSTCTGVPSATDCRTLIGEHLVGITNAAGKTRCPSSGCQLFGAIYHSVPTTVPGRPSELLRDESYEGFATEMAALARPSVLYTSTVDGFLHAFNLAPFPNSTNAADRAVDSKENNELWSFIPPAVLPVLQAQYPNTPAVLLDGVPIIKDVVATKQGTGATAVVKSYERLEADAQAGGGFWRTVLVQGFGATSMVPGGYFALDITDPDRSTTGKPTFRWQLTNDSAGNALFGKGGTPLITTVFLAESGAASREVAVAVLPGGDAPPIAGTAANIGTIMETEPGTFKTSRPVHNYAAADASRSLTIVRLDTGAVIRTFRPSTGGALSTARWSRSRRSRRPSPGSPRRTRISPAPSPTASTSATARAACTVSTSRPRTRPSGT